MADNKHIAAQLAELRAEIEALKAERKGSSAAPTEAASHALGDIAAAVAGQLPEQLREFETAIKELAEAVESDIEDHPIAAVGAAFLLGLLIGRLSAR